MPGQEQPRCWPQGWPHRRSSRSSLSRVPPESSWRDGCCDHGASCWRLLPWQHHPWQRQRCACQQPLTWAEPWADCLLVSTVLIVADGFPWKRHQAGNENLRRTLSESLDGRDDLVGLGGSDNDLDLFKLEIMEDIEPSECTHLDRSVVNQKAIQLLEGLAGAVRLVECHVGDTTALRVGAVRDLDSLDGTNGLDEILLSGGNSVSLPKCSCTITAIPSSSLGRSSSGRVLRRQGLAVIAGEWPASRAVSRC